jgi:hypothetical protein
MSKKEIPSDLKKTIDEWDQNHGNRIGLYFYKLLAFIITLPWFFKLPIVLVVFMIGLPVMIVFGILVGVIFLPYRAIKYLIFFISSRLPANSKP